MGVYQNPGSPYWHYVFKLPGQKRFRGTTGTTDKKLAQQIYIEKRSQAQKMNYGFEQEKIKLKILFEDYLALCPDPSTSQHYNDVLWTNTMIRFFGDVYVDDLTSEHIEKYRIYRLKERLKKTSVNREMTLLKAIFNKGIEWGKCSKNPAAQLKPYSEKESQRVRYLEKHEKVRLLEVCPLPVRRLVFFALNTGMRRGEILNLCWKDVDFNANLIAVRKTKSKTPRYLPMNAELINMIKSMPSISEYVFGNENGQAKWTLYRKKFEKARTDAKITDFHFHDLRHCFASDLVMKGVDLKTVSELLGHSTTKMTERYAHLSPAHKQVAVELLPKGLLCSTADPLAKESEEGVINKIQNISPSIQIKENPKLNADNR
jgi:integrase